MREFPGGDEEYLDFGNFILTIHMIKFHSIHTKNK
jgi:hypothetical protein